MSKSFCLETNRTQPKPIIDLQCHIGGAILCNSLSTVSDQKQTADKCLQTFSQLQM